MRGLGSPGRVREQSWLHANGLQAKLHGVCEAGAFLLICNRKLHTNHHAVVAALVSISKLPTAPSRFLDIEAPDIDGNIVSFDETFSDRVTLITNVASEVRA